MHCSARSTSPVSAPSGAAYSRCRSYGALIFWRGIFNYKDFAPDGAKTSSGPAMNQFISPSSKKVKTFQTASRVCPHLLNNQGTKPVGFPPPTRMKRRSLVEMFKNISNPFPAPAHCPDATHGMGRADERLAASIFICRMAAAFSTSSTEPVFTVWSRVQPT